MKFKIFYREYFSHDFYGNSEDFRNIKEYISASTKNELIEALNQKIEQTTPNQNTNKIIEQVLDCLWEDLSQIPHYFGFEEETIGEEEENVDYSPKNCSVKKLIPN